jgi:ABC-type multidrug transport system fused ATPase/permease subunit
MWNTFWNFLWSTVLVFAFIAYLIILFNILVDLFWRDRATSGVAKAIWVVFLVVLPYLTALVYLITRGKGMAERGTEHAAAARKSTEEFIRDAAGRSPAQEISEAKSLLDGGVITAAEFDQLKSAALRQ